MPDAPIGDPREPGEAGTVGDPREAGDAGSSSSAQPAAQPTSGIYASGGYVGTESVDEDGEPRRRYSDE